MKRGKWAFVTIVLFVICIGISQGAIACTGDECDLKVD